MAVSLSFSKGRAGKVSTRQIVNASINEEAISLLKKRVIEEAGKKAKERIANGEILNLVADAYRLQIQDIARAYYIAMLKGCKALVNDSGIAAVAQQQEEPTRIGGRTSKGKLVYAREPLFAERGKVRGITLSSTQRIEFPKKHLSDLQKFMVLKSNAKNAKLEPSIPSSVSVSVPKVSWTKLRYDYYHRRPTSELFFKKRPGAARAAFISASDGWIGNAKSLRDKRGTQKLKATDTRATFQFTVEYPPLDAGFDIIRVAFVRGRKGYRIDFEPMKAASSPSGAEGILYAEAMRPMLRPYAAAMGNKLREVLKTLEKT